MPAKAQTKAPENNKKRGRFSHSVRRVGEALVSALTGQSDGAALQAATPTASPPASPDPKRTKKDDAIIASHVVALAVHGAKTLRELKVAIMDEPDVSVKRAHGCVWFAGSKLGQATGGQYSNQPLFDRILGPNALDQYVVMPVLEAVIYALEHGYTPDTLKAAVDAGARFHAGHLCRSWRVGVLPVLTAGLRGILSGRAPVVKEHSNCFGDGHVRLEHAADNEYRKGCPGVDTCRHNPSCMGMEWAIGVGADN